MKVHSSVYCIIVVETLLRFISVISLPPSGRTIANVKTIYIDEIIFTKFHTL